MAAATSGADATRRRPVKITRENVAEVLALADAFVLDCDGVIWTPTSTDMYPNTREALDLLKKAGKKVLFASNNSFYPPQQKFKPLGYAVPEDHVVVPSVVVARHLKRTGFTGKALALVSEPFKKTLRENGIDVVERTTERHDETIATHLRLVSADAGKVKAVIMDMDMSITGLDLTKATNYLREDPECCFLACASEKNLPIGGKTLLGPGYWTGIVEAASGRKAELVGKPAPMMVNEFLKDLHQLDLARSFFVGDSLHQDMGIANNCGMKKLLVLSGITKLKDLETCDPDLIPDFYIDSIGDLKEMLA